MRRLTAPVAWICLAAMTGALFPAGAAGTPAAGDSLGAVPEAAGTAKAPVAAEEPGDGKAPETAPFFLTNRRDRSRRWGLIGSGVGLVTGVGFALWVKSEADDRYDTYLNTADPDAARDAFDAAVRYDRATLIGWALAQVSFVAFVYFLTREEKRTLIPVEGEPLVRTRDGGFEIGFKVAP